MKYVGEALSEIEEAEDSDQRSIPLIGVATFDKLALKTKIENGRWGVFFTIKNPTQPNVFLDLTYVQRVGFDLPYSTKDGEKGYHLDKNHNHFFLVDGKDELTYVDQFVAALRQRHYVCEGLQQSVFASDPKIYALMLVVEGGENTLQNVKNAVDSKIPVVLVEGSGRAADLLSFAYRFLHDESAKSKGFVSCGLQESC
jgi:hypothetical protein